MANNIHSTSSPLVSNPKSIRLAMLGMVDGNGHPYSWAAIINGQYDAQAMADCGYAAIPQYLGEQPSEALGIPGTRVTHIWCDDRDDAEKVARAAYIENVVDHPEDVIGQVDAVVIATDIGSEHVERAKPFIEAGLPVFIDKPLTDNEHDLKQFAAWYREGRPILSTSCMRYAKEFQTLREQMNVVGQPRLIIGTMMKSWERYGIHALECVYGLLPSGGWVDVANTGTQEKNIVHLRHEDGVDVILPVVYDLFGGYGQVTISGTQGSVNAKFTDTFTAFKSQLEAYVKYLQTGVPPFDYQQTLEQMKIIIAGIRSREQQGRRVNLLEISC